MKRTCKFFLYLIVASSLFLGVLGFWRGDEFLFRREFSSLDDLWSYGFWCSINRYELALRGVFLILFITLLVAIWFCFDSLGRERRMKLKKWGGRENLGDDQLVKLFGGNADHPRMLLDLEEIASCTGWKRGELRPSDRYGFELTPIFLSKSSDLYDPFHEVLMDYDYEENFVEKINENTTLGEMFAHLKRAILIDREREIFGVKIHRMSRENIKKFFRDSKVCGEFCYGVCDRLIQKKSKDGIFSFYHTRVWFDVFLDILFLVFVMFLAVVSQTPADFFFFLVGFFLFLGCRRMLKKKILTIDSREKKVFWGDDGVDMRDIFAMVEVSAGWPVEPDCLEEGGESSESSRNYMYFLMRDREGDGILRRRVLRGLGGLAIFSRVGREMGEMLGVPYFYFSKFDREFWLARDRSLSSGE